MTGLMQKNHDITKLSAERFCAPPQRVDLGGRRIIQKNKGP